MADAIRVLLVDDHAVVREGLRNFLALQDGLEKLGNRHSGGDVGKLLFNRILLARLYTRRGYPDLALEHYRMAAAQFPDAPVVVISLAKALRDLDEPQEALRAIAAYEATHAEGNWELLSLEGVLYDEQGDLKHAEAAHRAAVAQDGTRGSLHNNLGYNLLLQRKPEFSCAFARRQLFYIKDPAQLDLYVEGLHRAGIPQ